MKRTALSHHLDEIADDADASDLPTVRAAKVLWAAGVAEVDAGFADSGEQILELAFAIVQDLLGPDDPRLGPFLHHFADAAEARGARVRADALRRRARACAPRTDAPSVRA